jgi:ubiquinone/menaquinone biosynthesis C-methylase UbiE
MPQFPPVKLPYFDLLLNEFEQGNAAVEKALGRHVHWGYWEHPHLAQSTPEDFAQAAERLSQLICQSAKIHPGMRVLDVGCGFGGTVSILNETHSGLELVGLNIDERQLERARQRVTPCHDNRIQFIQGNACNLPFPDSYFDVVTAVECISHFDDRSQYFQEATRVLKPGGRMALTDFLISEKTPALVTALSNLAEQVVTLLYGEINTGTMSDYLVLAEQCGFNQLLVQDITVETLPTFNVLTDLIKNSNKLALIPYLATRLVEFAQRSGLMSYKLLVYEKDMER